MGNSQLLLVRAMELSFIIVALLSAFPLEADEIDRSQFDSITKTIAKELTTLAPHAKLNATNESISIKYMTRKFKTHPRLKNGTSVVSRK